MNVGSLEAEPEMGIWKRASQGTMLGCEGAEREGEVVEQGHGFHRTPALPDPTENSGA